MPVTIPAFTGTGNDTRQNPAFGIGMGSDSRALLAEIEAGATPRNTDIYTEIPLTTDSTVGLTGAILPQKFLDGTAAMPPQELGIVQVEGDLDVYVSCDGTAVLFAGITDMLNPSGTAIGTHGVTTLMTTGALGAASGPHNLTLGTPIPSASGDPGRQIEVTFTGSTLTAANFQAGYNVAIIEFTGTDENGNNIRDQIPIYIGDIPSGANPKRKTKKFFRGAVTGTARGFNASVMGTITATNSASRVSFNPRTGPLARAYALEIAKTNVPNTYDDMFINSMNVSVTADAVTSMTAGWMGLRGRLYENLTGGTGLTDISSLTGVAFAEDTVFPGWSARLLVNHRPVAMIDGTFSITRNLEFPNVVSGSQYQVIVPYESGGRDVTISGNIIYSGDVRLDTDWFNRDFNVVELELTYNKNGIFPYKTVFILPDAQLDASPDPSIGSRTQVSQPISYKATDRSGNDYYINATYGNFVDPKTYTA